MYLDRLNTKRLRLRPEECCLFALILMATLLRLILIYFNWPITNSDEGNMGILARHVAYNGELPIFFYGNPYLGPVEGYLAAPLFHLFGPSTFTLRLGLLPFFPLFLVCMYYLTRLLYTQKLALFTVILLCFGSQEIIARQLKAVGEYPELLFFAAFISLIVSWLAFSYHSVSKQSRTTARRIFIYGVLGLVMGVALWVDLLILPFLATGLVILLLFCHRELVSWASISLLLGIMIGAFPQLYYNVTAPLKNNSIAVLLSLSHVGSHPQPLQQIIGTLMISLPNATGFNALCLPQAFPYFGVPNVQCIVLQGGWGLGYVILWAIATFFVVRVICQGWKGTSLFNPTWEFAERQDMIRHCCQLMLLVSAGGTLVLYTLSSVSALVPAPTSRYLVCLLVATPATLWPLWNGISTWRTFVGWRASASFFIRGSLLMLILIMFILGTFRTFNEISSAQIYYRQQDQLIQKLLSLRATRIYSEYWTCNRLIFQSGEQIICSSLNENLSLGFDRYLPYRDIVRAAPHPAYVFPLGMQQTRSFDAMLHKNRQLRNAYQRLVFKGYVIYVPNI